MRKGYFKQMLMGIALGFVIVPGTLSVTACANKKANKIDNKKVPFDGEENDNKAGKPVILNGNTVNGSRDESVKNQVNKNANYLFQPYYDTTLYSRKTIKDVIQGKQITLKNNETVFNQLNNFDGVTLAFVQQAVDVKDRLAINMGGQSFEGDGYDWGVETKFQPEVLFPLVDANIFKNVVVAYGGAASAVGYNPGDIAYKLANKNIDEAVSMLMPALIEYQQRLTKHALGNPNDYPLNLDFDIEGVPFDQDHIGGITVLFNTLAKMKVNNPKGNFTITLPVLRTGLVARDIDNVLKPALSIFKNYGLTKKSDLFNVNIMAMDYGEATGKDVIKENISFFKVATDAAENTRRQYQLLVEEIGHVAFSYKDINSKLFITPMIGINDVNNNYFTLEDAKDLYNGAQENKIAGLKMGSLNRDDPGKPEKQGSATNHGLKYLNLGDYTHVFTGDGTDGVKEPVRKIVKS